MPMGPAPPPPPPVYDRAPPPDGGVVVFTDGAASNNGRRNCRAGYACVFPHYAALDVARPLSLMPLASLTQPPNVAAAAATAPPSAQTNNRAEFAALLAAYERCDIIDPGRARRLLVYTDSELLVRSLVRWLPSWKRRGWRRAGSQEPVKNADLLQALDQRMSQRRTTLHHVPASHGRNARGAHEWLATNNDRADRLARGAAAGGSYDGLTEAKEGH